MLCRRAREQVTVCLSGEGGDEILAGYDRFRASRLHRIYERLPERFRRGAVAPLVGRLPERPAKKGPINLLKRFVAGGLLPEDGGHLRWQYFLPPELARELLAKELCEAAADPFASVRHTRERGPKNDALAAELFVETRYFLPASPLMKVDKLSMAHGLEVRVPLLDHRLVELVAGIPSRHKLRGLRTKAIFRDAMRGVLPERIRSRGKQGYSLPVKHLLRGELSELLADSLSSSPLVRDAFRRPAIERLQREHHEGRANHSHLLWALLNLALWHRQYCEGGSLAPQPLADPAPSLARAV
jgi:asparagine synthase (glutamine-hydrolysing)